MSEHITVTATVAAWLPSHYQPADLIAALEAGDGSRVTNMLHLYGNTDMASFANCLRVGEADVTLRLLPRDEQTRLAVQALKAKLEKLRAAYLTAQQEIYEQLTNLQALTNEV